MQKENKFAIFNYNEKDNNLVLSLSEYLDQHGKRIFDFFELPIPEQKVNINIIPTKAEFDSVFIKDHMEKDNFVVPGWCIGYMTNGEITYLSLSDMENTTHSMKQKSPECAFEYYHKTLLHEFVHYVNRLFEKHRDCSPTIKYLLEGIATYLSNQAIAEKVPLSFTLENILETDMNKSCYGGWFLMTKYLVENYDKNFVLSLFESNRQAKEFLINELYDKAKEFYSNELNRQ